MALLTSRFAKIVSAVLLIGTTLATASPALASGAETPGPAPDGKAHLTRVSTDRQSNASADKLVPFSWNGTCFGYTGTFHDGTGIFVVDWYNDGSNVECFGIAPGRTIWHAWPGSGRWQQMPNGGRADTVTNAFLTGEFLDRTIQVHVTSSGNYFCSTDNGSGIWSPWTLCAR